MADVGKNMLDLRVSNRVAMLNLLYAKGGMSRKEIASRLNLTPAAISHITSDLIEEGVLVEAKKVEGSSRMGRREILLEIDMARYLVLCAYIGTRDVRVSCINLGGQEVYGRSMTFDNRVTGEYIVGAICDDMQSFLNKLPEERRRCVIGVGLGVKGIVDNVNGISRNSFGLWEDNVPVGELVRQRLGLKVLVDNNIRCVASAEMLFNHNEGVHSMLFAKYGPLVGGALVLDNELFRGYSYHAMELGHFIVEPMGSICRCGKRGCLETVIGFDIIGKHLELHYSAARMPILYRITQGNPGNIRMETIMDAFEEGERAVCDMMDGALDRFALALVNALVVVNPQRITLYGYPFESEKLIRLLKEKVHRISTGEVSALIEKSKRNMQLDDLGCASIVIKDFLGNGAIYTAIQETPEETDPELMEEIDA